MEMAQTQGKILSGGRQNVVELCVCVSLLLCLWRMTILSLSIKIVRRYTGKNMNEDELMSQVIRAWTIVGSREWQAYMIDIIIKDVKVLQTFVVVLSVGVCDGNSHSVLYCSIVKILCNTFVFYYNTLFL